MENAEIKVTLTEAAVAEILNAITNKSVLLVASNPDARYETLHERRCAVGGMLELARRLNADRLVNALEVHKDAISRQIEVL